MSKYSGEFKLKVVNYYLSNAVSYKDVAIHFNITSATSVQRWVRQYNKHGGKGLLKNSKWNVYITHTSNIQKIFVKTLHK